MASYIAAPNRHESGTDGNDEQPAEQRDRDSLPTARIRHDEAEIEAGYTRHPCREHTQAA
jgi:hypothetical protein